MCNLTSGTSFAQASAMGAPPASTSRAAFAKETAQQMLTDFAAHNTTDNFHYWNASPSERIDDKMIGELHAVMGGTLILIKWDAVAKYGLAANLMPSQEKHVTMLVGAIHMVYVRYRMTSNAETSFGQHDEASAKYMEQATDANGKVTQTERKWFFDYRALEAFIRMTRYPLAVITDDKQREEQCQAIWTALQSACSQIGTRTLTTVVMELLDGSIIRDVKTAAEKQSISTPRRSTGGASSSSETRSASSTAKGGKRKPPDAYHRR